MIVNLLVKFIKDSRIGSDFLNERLMQANDPVG